MLLNTMLQKDCARNELRMTMVDAKAKIPALPSSFHPRLQDRIPIETMRDLGQGSKNTASLRDGAEFMTDSLLLRENDALCIGKRQRAGRTLFAASELKMHYWVQNKKFL